jgi:hypothetical protein
VAAFSILTRTICVSPGWTVTFWIEILVAVLAYRDRVLTRQKQDLFRSLEFFQIANVLPVNPNAGRLLDICLSFQLNFSEHVTLLGADTDGQGRPTAKTRTHIQYGFRSNRFMTHLLSESLESSSTDAREPTTAN